MNQHVDNLLNRKIPMEGAFDAMTNSSSEGNRYVGSSYNPGGEIAVTHYVVDDEGFGYAFDWDGSGCPVRYTRYAPGTFREGVSYSSSYNGGAIYPL